MCCPGERGRPTGPCDTDARTRWPTSGCRRATRPVRRSWSCSCTAASGARPTTAGTPGGWPGTFDDVLAAVRQLPALVSDTAAGRVTTGRMVLAGHSAGGHLALWAAAQESGLARPDLLTIVGLAGVCDLAACHRLRLGQDAASELMGGGPEEFPDRYLLADPMAAIPARASVILVHGLADDRVPWQQSGAYATAASAAGGQARCVLLPDAGHFDVIDPLSPSWPAVQAEFLSASGLRPTS
jgi:acetyl esterase/lipase